MDVPADSSDAPHSPDGLDGAAGPASPKWLAAQRALLWILCGLAGLLVVGLLVDFAIVNGLLGRYGLRIALTLTPAAWRVLTVVIVVLFAAAAVSTAWRPERKLTPLALTLGFLAIGAFLGNPKLAGLVVLGWLALLVAFIVGSTRGDPVPGRRFGRLLSLAVALAFMALVVLAAGLAFKACDAMFGDFGSATEFARVASPDGAWVAVGVYNDGGATGGDSHVHIERDVDGVLRLWRDVWLGEDPEPEVRWLDSRTVSVKGNAVDIYSDPPIY